MDFSCCIYIYMDLYDFLMGYNYNDRKLFILIDN